jgi:hypothetical protein
MKSAALALLLLVVASSSFGATIVIVNLDPPGVGFNDPTPAVPVGGNPGTTIGQQRLNSFQYAANLWGAKLTSPITIRIGAEFSPLSPCSPSSGVIGSAGPTTYLKNFPNAPRSDTWYPIAQASALSGIDFAGPGQFNFPDGIHIGAQFNSLVGSAGCLQSTFFYLGLDANEGIGIDLVTLLLHEFAHGLGFAGITNLATGGLSTGGTGVASPDIFAVFTRDNTAALNWNVMSNAQRLTSVTNAGNVVFDGANATGAAATILTAAGKDPSQHPKLFTPNPLRQGSSVYHFDTTASPNLLMEPGLNSDVTHNVDVPNDLTTKAFADMGWPMPAAALSPPPFVSASATSPSLVAVTWMAVPGATSYRVFRTAHDSTTYSQIATGVVGTSFNDGLVSGGRSYLYRVRAFNGTTESADSSSDLATTVIFTDANLIGAAVKAAHFTELRTAANALRTLAGMGGGSFTDAALTSALSVKRLHVTELYTALNAGRTTLLLPLAPEPAITAGVTSIQAAHLMTLRMNLQ